MNQSLRVFHHPPPNYAPTYQLIWVVVGGVKNLVQLYRAIHRKKQNPDVFVLVPTVEADEKNESPKSIE